MNEGDVLPPVERTITQDGIAKYAAASGDFNPIHVDEAFAADSQFGGTIAHGMLVAAALSEVMSAAFGLDWLDSGRLKLRFRAPVFPGDIVVGDGEGVIVIPAGIADEIADEAVAMGMANASVPHAQLETKALEWGRIINGKSPTAMRMLKLAFNMVDDGLVGQQLFAGEATRLAYASEEAQEGRDAFLEKREQDYSKFPWHY